MTEQLGSDTYVYVSTEHGADPLLVRVGGEMAVRPGDPVGLTAEDGLVHVFEKSGSAVAPLQRHSLSSAA